MIHPPTHFDSLRELQNFAYGKGALLIPHHPAYRQGRRGANPTFWDTRVTRHLEIFSEHGNAENNHGPYDYIRHSMGGRWSPNTLQHILDDGHRVGILASTDDHLGYPGAYGEGLAAILSPELTREALFDALSKRCVYGVTGVRILLDFRMNNHLMGEELAFTDKRSLSADVTGWDRIDCVELVRNGQVIHRDFPTDNQVVDHYWDEPLILRIEFGWGPWASLEMARVCDWEIEASLKGGRILEYQPCFQSGPLEEERRNLVTQTGENTLRIQSYTSRRQALAEKPTNAVVLKVQAEPESLLEIRTSKPSKKGIRKKLSGLAGANDIVFTGPFPDESILIHRLVPQAQARSSFTVADENGGDKEDWYYLRVVQSNGHMAWSSPIWIDERV